MQYISNFIAGSSVTMHLTDLLYLSLGLVLGVSSSYLGQGLLYDWLFTSGRVAFIQAGGPAYLTLTDLNFLISAVGLLAASLLIIPVVTIALVSECLVILLPYKSDSIALGEI